MMIPQIFPDFIFRSFSLIDGFCNHLIAANLLKHLVTIVVFATFVGFHYAIVESIAGIFRFRKFFQPVFRNIIPVISIDFGVKQPLIILETPLIEQIMDL